MEQLDKNWYVVNTYASHENKVKDNILRRIETMNMQDYIFRVIVAEYEEPVKKNGVPTGKTKMKNMYPGYIFIEMYMTDEAWYVVRNTPGVTGFIGSSGKGAKPFPLSPQEVDKILGSMGMSRLEIGSELNVDDSVKVISGPFSGMFGKVKSIDTQTGKLEVALDLFGQETIVELTVGEIEKTA